MSSFPETKVEKWISRPNSKLFVKYHAKQFSRVYPKGQRIDSSNYDPIRIWNCGCQMVALNYQTPDKPMQLNQGKFAMNGKCGFVLRPQFMFKDEFDPYDYTTLEDAPITLSIRIVAARHLTKSGRGIVSPFVEVDIIGAEYDSSNKYKTETKVDNGFNPMWNEFCEFDIKSPEFAMLRFVVQDEDMFGDPNFLGQATFMVKGIRPGYRSVPLKNGYSEELELASLLVHLDIRNVREEEEEIYTSIQCLRDRSRELSQKIEEQQKAGNETLAESFRTELQEMEEQLLAKNEERRRRVQTRSLSTSSASSSSSHSKSATPAAKWNVNCRNSIGK